MSKLKANELMIGDWANIYVFPNENPKSKDLFPAKITAILTPTASENSGDTIECMFTALDGTGGVGYASRPPETFLPIPLTAEILEKNGFERRKLDGGAEEFVLADDYFDITIEEWSDSIWVVRYDCTEMNTPHEQAVCGYVHQLQNFFRLSAPDELADNFKV